MTLPACHSRRELPEGGSTYFCAHPMMHCADQLVTSAVCSICSYWRQPPPEQFRPFDPAGLHVRRTGDCFHLGEHVDWKECPTCAGHVRLKVFACRHPLHHQTTIGDCQKCRDYENPLRRGTVREWAVGMTTAPRAVSAIERTLDSLKDAGFGDVRLFAEPESLIPSRFLHLPIVWRESRLGPFPNWLLALSEMYLRQPRADAFLLCQDDVQFARGLRTFLEAELWPAEHVGVVSLYAGGDRFSRLADGFHRDESGWDALGALAYVFPNVALRTLLSHPLILSHRRRGPTNGEINIDSLVGEWCRTCGLPAFVHVPGLAQHLGDTSTLSSALRNTGNRHSQSFVTEIA